MLKNIACGHYFCGGIEATLQNKDFGILDPWLRNIRDVYRLHSIELNAKKNDTDRSKRFTA
jgi:carbonic anhydrase